MSVQIEVCRKCRSKKAQAKDLMNWLEKERKVHHLSFEVSSRGCLGKCKKAPACRIKKGDQKEIWKKLSKKKLRKKLSEIFPALSQTQKSSV